MVGAAGAAVAMIVVAVTVALAITGRLSILGPAPSFAATIGPTDRPSAVPDDVGSLLCTAVVDLATAHSEHASPLATLMGDNIANGGNWSAADIASARAHVQAIGVAVATHIQAVAQLHSATFADLILQVQKAYAGYGQGALALKTYTAELPNGAMIDPDLTTGLDGLTAGHEALTSALNEMATFNAAGTVSCQVPIF
jgi:hypothetical protein